MLFDSPLTPTDTVTNIAGPEALRVQESVNLAW
jgi:hypothetical protein